MAHKAANAIVRRLSSPASYARRRRLRQTDPFPPHKRETWRYLRDDQGRAVARSLLEALRWARGVLGLIVQPAISASPRLIQGQAVGGAPVKRAPALPVAAIQRLEELTATAPDPRDRATAGAILFGILSCARASDLARAIGLHIDCLKVKARRG